MSIQTEAIFFDDPKNYNQYNEIGKQKANEALTLDSEGKIQYRENGFNKDVAYSDNVLSYRDAKDAGFYERKGNIGLTEKGYVTVENNFNYNNGNKNNVPSSHDDTEDSESRLSEIYKVGKLNVNALRSLNNKDQEV